MTLPNFTREEEKGIEIIFALITREKGHDIEVTDLYLGVRELFLLHDQREYFQRMSSAEWWNLIRGVMSECDYTPYALYPNRWYVKYRAPEGGNYGLGDE